MSAQYLVEYGRLALLGRMSAELGQSLVRGDRVVIAGPRGRELGLVRCSLEARFASAEPEGVILRRATTDDLAAEAALQAWADDLREAARAALHPQTPLTILDCEMTLDRQSAILIGLADPHCDPHALLEPIARRFGLPIRFLDLAQFAPAPKQTPSPCSSCTSCACSTAGCGTGSRNSPGTAGKRGCSSAHSASGCAGCASRSRRKTPAPRTSIGPSSPLPPLPADAATPTAPDAPLLARVPLA